MREMRTRVAALAACAVLGWVSPVAGAPSPQSGLPEALSEELLTELDDFAEWANGRKLYVARNDAFAVMLKLDDENERAYKGLKYKRNKSGGWDPPSKPPKVKNYGKKDLEEMEQRWDAIADAHRARVMEVFEAEGLGPHHGKGARLLESCLWLDETDEAVRALRLEVLVDGEWVLQETARGKVRRGELRDLREQALGMASAQVESAEVSADEASLGVSFRALATPAVRVLGATDPEELQQAAVANHAVGDFFRSVFDRKTTHWNEMTIFLMSSERDRDTFLNSYPGMTPEEREFRRGLIAAGFPKSPDVAAWDGERLRRLDAVTRHTMGSFFIQAFDISTGRGWVWEGFGMYLTRALIGTRLTWYITGPATADPASQKLRSLLMGSKANWMNEAYKMIEKGEAPPLAATLSKGVDTMEVTDTLLSYALAAYLLEGWPDKVGPLLEAVGRTQRPEEAFQEVLGMDLESVEARLARWIGERR